MFVLIYIFSLELFDSASGFAEINIFHYLNLINCNLFSIPDFEKVLIFTFGEILIASLFSASPVLIVIRRL